MLAHAVRFRCLSLESSTGLLGAQHEAALRGDSPPMKFCQRRHQEVSSRFQLATTSESRASAGRFWGYG